MSESIYAPDGRLILSVVYDLDMHPHSVNVCNWSGGVDAYDFAWCKRDACCYHHLSGGGGGVPFLEGVPHFLTSAGNGWVGTGKRRRFRYHYHRARTRLWLDPSVDRVRVAGGRKHEMEVDRDGLRRDGWFLLHRAANPFDDAEDDRAHWCVFCEDDLPEENLCEHLDWCDRCNGGDVVYVKTDPGIAVPSHSTRCRHRRLS